MSEGIVLLVAAAALAAASLTWLALRPGRVAREARLRTLEAQLAEERQAAEALRGALREAEGARAAAEERAARVPELEARLQAREKELAELRERHAQLMERVHHVERSAQEKLALLEEARARLAEAFQALSAEALRHNNQAFLELARQSLARFHEAAKGELEARRQAVEALARPIRESLEKVDARIRELEQARAGAYAALSEQVRGLLEVQRELRGETARLVKALRQPHVRGRWGELQLRRVVDMAGMAEHCDFQEQVSAADGEGGRLRPDLVVHLPGGKRIVVDAKAPVDAYMAAVEAPTEEERRRLLERHAKQLRQHIDQLGRKQYFAQFQPSPEFVVLFVPGEAFFSAALAVDPELIEYGTRRQVIPASPTTLIALLKAAAYGWRQEAVARNAAEVARQGRELYQRLGKLGEHWVQVGRRLEQAVQAYNRSVGTLEGRVLPAARRFETLQAAPPEGGGGTEAAGSVQGPP